ncbi:peptidase M26 [Alloprevotella tannerae]
MKQQNIIQRLCLFLFVLVLAVPALAQKERGGGTFNIGSAADWKTFCDRVNKGETTLNAKMTADIELNADIDFGQEIVMVGNQYHLYSGTFDGQGHTLTINWNTGTRVRVAPFQSVENTTIKNLHVKGEIKSKGDGLTGLIANVYGTTTISGCIIEVNLKAKTILAGMVRWVISYAKLTITDCIVKGDFTVTKKGKIISGFVCRQYGNCSLTNCLYLGTNNADNNESYTFAGNNTEVKNCYYLNACGKAQGTKITDEQLKNGAVAHMLQARRSQMVWGQTIGTDALPQFTADEAKKICKVDFVDNGKTVFSRYVNKGGKVTAPTVQDIKGTSYTPHHYYALTVASDFNANAPINDDMTVEVSFTEKDAYEIASKDDWKAFCDIVESGQTSVDARLERNVDLGSDIVQVGTSSKYYSGTFDGQGHTLTVNWNVNASDIAPFRHVRGATIKNLRTAGTIKSSRMYIGGLIDEAYGETTVTGCVSNVDLTSTYADNHCGAGGMVSYIGSNSRVDFTDCIVKGSIYASTDKGKTGMGGFVYGQNGTCTFTNCLYVGTNNANTSSERINTFAHNATVTNCYYRNNCGRGQGTQATEEQLRNGYVAAKLQGSRSNQVWGQAIGTDNAPDLTDDDAKQLYKVEFTRGGKVVATRYANPGKSVGSFLATIPARDVVGTGYNANHFYALSFDGGFTATTPVNGNMTVGVSFTEKDHYEIKSAADWKNFCELVNNGGQNGMNVKMTADVNIGSDIAKAGTSGIPYCGIFDGQNHVLTLNWKDNANSDIAPFRRVSDATIKNLRTEGSIQSSSFFLSGLIDEAAGGNITVSNCVSNVNLTSTTNDMCRAAGLVNYIFTYAHVTINDCLVKGSINATTDKGKEGMGGFVYVQNGTLVMNNCLYVGTNNAKSDGEKNNTFAPTNTSGATTLNNCYYLNACGTLQGDQATAAQLRCGEVTYKLQAGRDMLFWGQTIGTDTIPLLTTEAAKQVYGVKFTLNGKVKAMRYANKGGHVVPPTVQELLGADYAPNITYALSFEGDFSASSTVTGNTTVVANVVFKDISIATKEDWRAFSDLVLSGEGKLNAKLTADLNLGTEILKIGSESTSYSGTFDGQGHTITIDWNVYGSDSYVALFPSVTNATIKNLRITGQMTSDSEPLGVFAFEAGGTTIYEHCVSDVRITSGNTNSSYCAAGMVRAAYSEGKITFKDCIVAGDLNGTTDNSSQNMGGFVCSQADDATCTFDNCLYTGTNNSKGGYTFAPNPTLNNCYYLHPFANPQGTKITAEQLKSGEVTKKLQNNRTDKCYWAQQLGEMPDFYNTADKSKANYVYYDAAKKGWTCDDFRLTDGQPLPIGLDFTAANVTYERDLSIGKATLCLPYDLYAQGFKAYTLSGGNKNEVHFKETKDKLTAYTPYYITADGTPLLGGTNIEVKAYTGANLTTSANGYSIKGTVVSMDNATAAAANAYILQDDGMFHKVTTDNPGATVPAYHAYIICPPQASGAKQLSVVLDGETTGIGDVTNEATDGKNGPVYDLQGRRVADRLDGATRHSLPAGVYIVGGRKVVVK